MNKKERFYLQIILGKTAGFCFGVQNAVDKTLEISKNNKKIQCLGELVHNTQVTEMLTKQGVEFIENIKDGKQKVIIRSHGVPKETYEYAKSKGIELFDLTCPKVLNVHRIAEKYEKEGWYIFLVGKPEHPETIGTMSFCGESYSIIQDEGDVEKAIQEFNISNCKNALLISQTTYSLLLFEKISEEIKLKIPNIKIQNTICSATRLRQEETEKIAKEVELMIIIGSKHSSNSNKLYSVASKYCKNTIFVETKKDIDLEHICKYSKIGIMAGASTPKQSIDEIVDIIKKIC